MEKNTIIGIQEHWLFNYESHMLEDIHPDFKVSSRCVDDNDMLTPLHKPRGYGGVALFWNVNIHRYVSVVPEGNSRVQAILLDIPGLPLCVINSYLPAKFGRIGDSDTYDAAIDVVRELILKYQAHYTIIWIGDMNGSLHRHVPVDRDKALRGFVAEMGLTTHSTTPGTSTYHHHSGRQSSKIYHVMYHRLHRTFHNRPQ
jgi:hypothetical protein